MLFAFSAQAASLEVRIEVLSVNPARVLVEGKIRDDKQISFNGKRWSFLDYYADAHNLSARITKLELFDAKNRSLTVKKLLAGEYETESEAAGWRYEMNLEAPADETLAAHVSWIGEKRGLLMPGDLLPQFGSKEKISAQINLVLPKDWRVATAENQTAALRFSTDDVDRAVFLVGNEFKERTDSAGKTELRLAMSDGWAFSDDEAAAMASRILEEHHKLFGENAPSRVQLIFLPFQRQTSSIIWRAETRGATIVLLSGATSFKSLAINRLHEQLRHEIFHLWIPNELNLSGQYDWFYEGFTLYQALKIGVRMNQIRFEDYLDTMSRAFDAARFAQRVTPLSLLEASQQRWRGGTDLVYAKGMVVAFLCDVAMLRESGGKRSLEEVFRELYKKHRFPAARQDGNTAVISILKNSPAANSVIARFVEKPNQVEWNQEIAALGLLQDSTLKRTRLRISEKLNGRQRDLLKKLGYKRELSVAHNIEK